MADLGTEGAPSPCPISNPAHILLSQVPFPHLSLLIEFYSNPTHKAASTLPCVLKPNVMAVSLDTVLHPLFLLAASHASPPPSTK
jgi:hypothetical protein